MSPENNSLLQCCHSSLDMRFSKTRAVRKSRTGDELQLQSAEQRSPSGHDEQSTHKPAERSRSPWPASASPLALHAGLTASASARSHAPQRALQASRNIAPPLIQDARIGSNLNDLFYLSTPNRHGWNQKEDPISPATPSSTFGTDPVVADAQSHPAVGMRRGWVARCLLQRVPLASRK
jgi:hypothetical protein